MQILLVSGGFFDQTLGLLTVIEKTTEGLVVVSDKEIQHPKPEIAVLGKGITGIAIDGDYVWACFSNVIVKISLDDFSIQDMIENEYFNDLHSIEIRHNHLYIANTGNESVDIINLETRELVRFDLLGEGMRKLRPLYSQDQDTKPHLHHISSVTIDEEGDVIIGLVRQQRILNLGKWEWIGGKHSSPVHDVEYIDGKIWFTTVGGTISNSEEFWNLADYQSELGWTRGLAVTDEGMYVGTTAIRESNQDYYKVITDSPTERTGAKICYIPFNKNSETFELEVSMSETRKIFSIQQLISE
ncbi:hypothetical protein OAO34_02195 [Candidatus Poseidoniaceae archaeon]|nr:hypothetical protein [Candidatus Poseidoniaceae archaeon]